MRVTSARALDRVAGASSEKRGWGSLGCVVVMTPPELEERLRSAGRGSVGSSSLSPGAKYSLWRAASDLPLHRVSDRLSVGHLQPRSSRDRYR